MSEDQIFSTVPDIESNGEALIKALCEYLESHKDTTFTAAHLAQECGFKRSPTEVQLRKAIAYLRDLGHPVVSNNDGFEYTTDPEKIAHCIQGLQNRIDGILRSKAGLERAYERSKLKEKVNGDDRKINADWKVE